MIFVRIMYTTQNTYNHSILRLFLIDRDSYVIEESSHKITKLIELYGLKKTSSKNVYSAGYIRNPYPAASITPSYPTLSLYLLCLITQLGRRI